MKRKILGAQRIMTWLGILLLLVACGTPRPIPTAIPPTATILPTATIPPTPTLTAAEIAAFNPAPRGYISMAYDAESNQIIMYGGQTGDYTKKESNNQETWAFDVVANKWVNMNPSTNPGKRGAIGLAYDSESDRVILFGGCKEMLQCFEDTWAYDYNSNTWTKLSGGPANVIGHRLVYDSESDRVILFGGIFASGLGYKKTWAYDFNTDTWTDMKPETYPPLRNFHGMTYDAKADRILLWGSLKVAEPTSIWTYDFNTNTWQELPAPTGEQPLDRPYPMMVYDTESDRTIMYGGMPVTNNETWAYDYNTNTWTKMKPATTPFFVSRHAMVYNTATDRIILFGGQIGETQYLYTAETWAYDFNTDTWTNLNPHP